MSAYDISVIIVHYNTPNLLHNCVESLYEHTTGIRFEVIIVDNNSSEAPNYNAFRQSNLTWIKNTKNTGFAAANNQAAQMARGKYLFFLNTDTYLTSNALDICYTYIVKHPEAGIVGPRLRQTDHRTQYYGSCLGRWQYIGTSPRRVGFISGAAILMNTYIYRQIGGFDEKFFFYNEDLDLGLTLRRYGFRLIYHPKAFIYHLGGQSSRLIKNIQQQAWKSSWYLLRKHVLRRKHP